MMKKILVVDEMHESLMPMLSAIGFEVDYEPKISRQEIIAKLSGYSGLIIRSKTNVNAELLENADKLQFVARAGAGVDKLDVALLEKRGIAIINAPEGNRDAVGEHALGLLLNLLNNISRANREVKKGFWLREENRGIELKGKVVGIYGFGNTGESFAKKLQGMDCSVVAYDKYKSGFSSDFVTELDELAFEEQVEILSIHIPLTEETRFLFNSDKLARYKNLKVIINTARGEVLRLADALKMIKDETLMAMGLDVLENEKFDQYTEEEVSLFKEIASCRNVLITPHVAGWTQESYVRINEVLVEKIKKLELVN